MLSLDSAECPARELGLPTNEAPDTNGWALIGTLRGHWVGFGAMDRYFMRMLSRTVGVAPHLIRLVGLQNEHPQYFRVFRLVVKIVHLQEPLLVRAEY